MKGIIDCGDMQDIQQGIYIVQEKIKILEKEEKFKTGSRILENAYGKEKSSGWIKNIVLEVLGFNAKNYSFKWSITW